MAKNPYRNAAAIQAEKELMNTAQKSYFGASQDCMGNLQKMTIYQMKSSNN